MGDVVYVVALEYLFGIIMVWDWFKLFITFCLGLEIVRESRGGMCLFSGQLIDVIDLEGDGWMGLVLFNLINSFMILVLLICWSFILEMLSIIWFKVLVWDIGSSMFISLLGFGETCVAMWSGGDSVLLNVIHLGHIYKNEGERMSWVA